MIDVLLQHPTALLPSINLEKKDTELCKHATPVWIKTEKPQIVQPHAMK